MYVRLSRKRFWHGDVDTDKHTAYTTLFTVLETVLRLLAPFVPFTAEELYRGLRGHEQADLSVGGNPPTAEVPRLEAGVEQSLRHGGDLGVVVQRRMAHGSRLSPHDLCFVKARN